MTNHDSPPSSASPPQWLLDQTNPQIPPPPESLSEADIIPEPTTLEGVDVVFEDEAGPEAAMMTRKKNEEDSKPNEDQGVVMAKEGILAAFDGLGGVPGGHVASAEAAKLLDPQEQERRRDASQGEERTRWENVHTVMASSFETFLSKEQVETALRDVMVGMDTAVQVRVRNDASLLEAAKQAVGEEKVERKIKEVGTTASLMKRWRDADGKDHVTVAQVGDSRIYRVRDGKLEQLTQDDSIERLFACAGIRPEDMDQPIDVNAKDADLESLQRAGTYPSPYDERSVRQMRGLLAALKKTGVPKITPKQLGGRNMMFSNLGASDGQEGRVGFGFEPAIRTIDDVREGDGFFGVSDGVCDNLPDAVIERIAVRFTKDGKTDTKAFTDALVNLSKVVSEKTGTKPEHEDVMKKLIRQEFSDLGIEVSSDEAGEMLKNAKPDDTTVVGMRI